TAGRLRAGRRRTSRGRAPGAAQFRCTRADVAHRPRLDRRRRPVRRGPATQLRRTRTAGGTMSLSGFTSPWWLLLLFVVAALGGAYVLVQRRRQTNTLRFTNLELLEKVAPARPGRARHIPVALLLVGLVFLTVALAGPTAEQRVPRNRATVVLVIDVSLSMEATDVAPTRLAAAQEAAKQFADDLTPGINLGLVAFSGTASVLVSPTTNREATKSAIDNLQLSERTATGEAIFTAM